MGSVRGSLQTADATTPVEIPLHDDEGNVVTLKGTERLRIHSLHVVHANSGQSAEVHWGSTTSQAKMLAKTLYGAIDSISPLSLTFPPHGTVGAAGEKLYLHTTAVIAASICFTGEIEEAL